MKPLILLDRDGVLNQLVVDAEHGTIDSPLHPEQIKLMAGVPKALKILTDLGYALSVVTNQPAAAKGKTTRENLEITHRVIIEGAQSLGGIIQSSHICFHRSEDLCSCRKPKTGLLEEAIAAHGGKAVWMVGDGVTDIQAGTALSLKTAFLGPQKCDACKIFQDTQLKPSFWGKNLLEFCHFLHQNKGAF